MTFDPMAAAVDWLDAYRDGDIGAILNMYADDAVTECGCEGLNVTGKKVCAPIGSVAFESVRRRGWTTFNPALEARRSLISRATAL